jgi:outer membrane receptor protein involved in Fe transport
VPRFTAAWGRDPWRVQFSAYTAFRAPTLNELFRGFRAGDTITRANESLLPERVRGADVTALRTTHRTSARVTAFAAWLDDPIANVTVTVMPSLIVRERRNAGRLRSLGVEAEATWRARTWLDVFTTLVATDAVFAQGPEPALEGNRVPQVPRWQARVGGRVALATGTDATLEVRYVGDRYEDDLNALPLGSATTVDALVAQRLWRGLQVFAAIENLFDEGYLLGRTPLPAIGAPRSVRVGLRWAMW